MAEIHLSRTACKALEREARRRLENSIRERVRMGKWERRDEYEKEERLLLACADVLGSLFDATLGWDEQEWKDTDETRPVEFSAEAVAWMEVERDSSGPFIEEFETNGEGDYSRNAEAVYLLHVLNRALGELAPREAVTV